MALAPPTRVHTPASTALAPGGGKPKFCPPTKAGHPPPLLHHHLEQGSSPRLEQNLDSGDCHGTGLLRRDQGVTGSLTQ